MEISLNAVDSSQIAAIGFGKEKPEDTHGTLEVQFVKSGRRWRYFDVAESVYREMMAAESVGRFFNQNVKSQYPGAEVF